jgi:hypothetical protein
LKYCIDQAERKVVVALAARDLLHYTHVPLARAIINQRSERRFCGRRYLTFEMRDNEPKASYTVQMDSDLSNLDEIKNVQREAQSWLSTEISRLKSMQDDLAILKEGYYETRETA